MFRHFRSNKGSTLAETALLIFFLCLLSAGAISRLGTRVNHPLLIAAGSFGVGTESGMERPAPPGSSPGNGGAAQ